MSNIFGLSSFRNSNSGGGPNNNNNDSEDENDGNDRYVGGVDSRGGGSGLAVQPNPDASGGGGDPAGSIFNLASPETEADREDSGDGGSRRRRVITMYRDGFTVDDGPYRRLDDPSNAEFLSSLARGMTPRELSEGEAGSRNITVGLVDKRSEEYTEQFRSFSGAGNSLGSSSTPAAAGGAGGDGVIRPEEHTPSSSSSSSGGKKTAIQVRLLSGRRVVARVSTADTVRALVDEIQSSGQAGSDPYVLMAGFPPAQLTDLDATIEQAGLAGASVTQKKHAG